MKRKLLIVLVLISWPGVWLTLGVSEDAPRMTKDELKAMLGNPDLTIIDVRYGKDWTGSDMKITGAVREEPGQVKSWLPNTRRTNPSFFTAPDPMKEQVPVWHKSLLEWDLRMSMLLRADGKNGLRPTTRSRRSSGWRDWGTENVASPFPTNF